MGGGGQIFPIHVVSFLGDKQSTFSFCHVVRQFVDTGLQRSYVEMNVSKHGEWCKAFPKEANEELGQEISIKTIVYCRIHFLRYNVMLQQLHVQGV